MIWFDRQRTRTSHEVHQSSVAPTFAYTRLSVSSCSADPWACHRRALFRAELKVLRLLPTADADPPKPPVRASVGAPAGVIRLRHANRDERGCWCDHKHRGARSLATGVVHGPFVTVDYHLYDHRLQWPRRAHRPACQARRPHCRASDDRQRFGGHAGGGAGRRDERAGAVHASCGHNAAEQGQAVRSLHWLYVTAQPTRIDLTRAP